MPRILPGIPRRLLVHSSVSFVLKHFCRCRILINRALNLFNAILSRNVLTHKSIAPYHVVDLPFIEIFHHGTNATDIPFPIGVSAANFVSASRSSGSNLTETNFKFLITYCVISEELTSKTVFRWKIRGQTCKGVMSLRKLESVLKSLNNMYTFCTYMQAGAGARAFRMGGVKRLTIRLLGYNTADTASLCTTKRPEYRPNQGRQQSYHIRTSQFSHI